MRIEDEKSKTPSAKTKTGEEAILDFLDKEIAAPAAADSQDGQLEDVDVLVNSLLRESIAGSDAAAGAAESGNEDLDKLFSNIFAKPKTESAGIRPAAPPLREAMPAARAQAPAAAAPLSAQPARPREPVAPVAASAVPPAARDAAAAPEPVAVFTMPPPKPAFNPRILVIGGAFACLLAGAGIVYYAGYRGKTAEPTDPAVSTAIASAPELNAPVTPPAAAETPASRPEGSRSDHAPAVSRGASAAAAGRPDAGRTTKAAPPAETSKPAAAEPQPAAATTNPPPVTGAPPSLPDPASTLVVSVSDVPAGNPPGRTGDSTTLPPVQATLPQASSNLSQLVPSAPGGLVGAAARDKVSLPIPAIPKRAVPAEVITRVQPVYSEIARRSRTTGTVVLDIAIDDQGKVTHATAVSGPAILRQAAVDAVLRWRFRPATLDGKSVTSTSQVTIVFK